MKVCLRRITEDDLEMVMNWRMLPHVTQYLDTDPKLTIEEQRAWFESYSRDDTHMVWIVCVEDKPAGVIQLMNIDRVNSRCSWGYYIAQLECRSLKLAMYLEWNLYDYVFDTLKLNKLCNETFAVNEQVRKLHILCGGHEDGLMPQQICKNGEYFDVSIGSILRDEWLEQRAKHKYEKYEFE